MRVDRYIVDVMRTLRQLVQALDNNITVQDNFGHSRAPKGHLIVSQGEIQVPKWESAGDALGTAIAEDDELEKILKGEKGDPGPVGATGPQGPPGPSGETTGHWEPLAYNYEVQFCGEGDVIMVWVNS